MRIASLPCRRHRIRPVCCALPFQRLQLCCAAGAPTRSNWGTDSSSTFRPRAQGPQYASVPRSHQPVKLSRPRQSRMRCHANESSDTRPSGGRSASAMQQTSCGSRLKKSAERARKPERRRRLDGGDEWVTACPIDPLNGAADR